MEDKEAVRPPPSGVVSAPRRFIGSADKMVAWLEIFLLCGFVTQTMSEGILFAAGVQPEDPLRALFNFATVDALLVILLVAALQWRRGGVVAPFGLHPTDWRKEFGIGTLVGLGLFLVVAIGSGLFLRSMCPSVPASRNLAWMMDGSDDLFLLLGLGIVGGGLREEVQRAFILRRFEVVFRSRSGQGGASQTEQSTGGASGTVVSPNAGSWVGLTLWSVLFGLSHSFQGLDAAITAVVAGLCLGGIFLWRQSLWTPMLSHTVANSATAFLAFYRPEFVR